MASPTKETWKKRDRRDARLLKKRHTKLRRALKKAPLFSAKQVAEASA